MPVYTAGCVINDIPDEDFGRKVGCVVLFTWVATMGQFNWGMICYAWYTWPSDCNDPNDSRKKFTIPLIDIFTGRHSTTSITLNSHPSTFEHDSYLRARDCYINVMFTQCLVKTRFPGHVVPAKQYLYCMLGVVIRWHPQIFVNSSVVVYKRTEESG
ncbi:hypothetical protein BDR07DRAFT_1375123 [Suillus spraguei]|nr:hypothetical protein BDR07DRAFT_1375123 [Suillus spraguei]